jgi:hypothetical protein
MDKVKVPARVEAGDGRPGAKGGRVEVAARHKVVTLQQPFAEAVLLRPGFLKTHQSAREHRIEV